MARPPAIPDMIDVNYSIDLPLELTPGREGLSIEVVVDEATAAALIPGNPGDVMTIYVKGQGDVAFQVGGADVQATETSNPIAAGCHPRFLIPNNELTCTHISFFGLDFDTVVKVNCYRRGT